MPRTSVGEILQQHCGKLANTLGLSISSARIEIQCLLQEVLGANRARILAHPEHLLTQEQSIRYDTFFERRISGEPIAYLLGRREFYGHDLLVTPATLIPRPETELLVEVALRHLPHKEFCRVLDLGTGNGAIALSIASARPNIEVIAVDASEAALEVARINMQRLAVNNTRFLKSDWFSNLKGEKFDIVISNPPYIADRDLHLTQGDVRFEPRAALVSGEDGLLDISRIIADSACHLNDNGWLWLEHGYNQALQVRGLLQLAGFLKATSIPDLASIERVSGGAKS